jgi:hypothetical protein
VCIEDLRIDVAGLVSRGPDGLDAVGSAAGRFESALPRAYFELVERVCVLEAMRSSATCFPALDTCGRVTARLERAEVFASAPGAASWVYSRSNGVALGRSWAAASSAAELELIERDRVLRSWYGCTRPIVLARAALTELSGLQACYDIEAYEFPAERQPGPRVAGVFGFPRSHSAPLVCGFGAGLTLEGALSRSAGECQQRLGFLWGEQIPSAEPEFALQPEYHQEYYLWPGRHARLRAWLAGEHVRYAGVLTPLVESPPRERRFVDLTPECGIGGLRVVKAIAGDELPLVFGRGHPWAAPSLPQELEIHPIA